MYKLYVGNLKEFELDEFVLSGFELKTFCHAISADCLPIEAARAHAINEHWAWRMADKFANLPAESRSAGRSTF